ncbi:DNA polymerase domain-containing protein [Halobaculum gomorrense]|uniref:DNA polymerase n=1 Tax=Halobaculum gomorrense TaxID=43928 RepID=A0A1M5KN53_9EURY|nr:DNA polymerase domain-containing protein [Halobaculum gomorrense]SHG53929.1 DNA polymerase I [Halobaculum gomorrense]
MSDSQAGLDQFAGGGDADAGDGHGDRPDAEAAHVAGAGQGRVSAVVDREDIVVPDSTGTVEFMVTAVDYTVEGTGAEEYPVVHVFGRTADNEPEHVRVLGIEPYFYVATADIEDRTLVEEYDVILDTREEGPNGGRFESIRGEPVTKVVARTPRDVGQIRDDFERTYEADILFPNRFLIDHGVTSGLRVEERRLDARDGENLGRLQVTPDHLEPTDVDADIRVNTFDIEVDDRNGFPEDGEEPVVCLTSHDSYRDEYVAWLYDAPVGGVDAPAALDDYEQIGDRDGDLRVETFAEEDAMLDAFLEYISNTDPDILTGWNFEDFDAPYFLDRCEELDPRSDYDLSPDRLSRVNETWRSGWGGPDVKGRVVFDLLYAYQRTQFSELESYRLDAVGELELNVGKERYTGDIGDLWERDPERLLEYNVRDVELCVEIDRKQNIVAFWDDARKFVGCQLEDAPTPGDAVDMYVLHNAFGDFVLPTKGQQEGEDFEGGAVFEPISGVEEMVSVLDLKSLYPMCMVTINASPETIVEDPDSFDGETYRAPNGTRFRKEPDGMMREMVDELLTERERLKGERNEHDPGSDAYEQYDRQQAATKVIMNCFTPDTEVVTTDGVKAITDLDVGDEVYSLDPETMEMETKPVTETHAYPDYRGDLIDIETSKMDFRVTPNHRMLVRKDETNGVSREEDDYRFVEAGGLDRATNYQLPHDWSGPDGDRINEVDLTRLLDDGYEVWANNDVHGHTLAAELGYYPKKVVKNDIGTTGYVFSAEEFEEHRDYLDSVCSEFYVHSEPNRKWVPRTYDGDDFLDLLAWYVTEGNVYTSEEKRFGDQLRGSATTVKIAQNAVADGGMSHHAAIGDLLDRMGFDTYVDDRAYQFTSKLLGEAFRELCGANSFEKRIPDLVFDASQEQKRRFLDTLIAGDGDRQSGNSWRYTTSSDRLRDDVLRLCAHIGRTANYNHDSGSWRIYCTEDSKNTLRTHRSGGRSTAEEGVYCVTVADNHTLLAGRNGKFQFVGQSLYGVSGWERFRLYDKENAAAITAMGRRVIEFTEQAVDELGRDVTYGDTDSVMLSLSDISEEEIEDATVSEEMAEVHPEMSDQDLLRLAAVIRLSQEIEEHINGRYDDFAREELDAEEHRFEIEFEKLYRRFFQAGKKKRYAGHIVWKEGKDVDDIDITGFEYKRSDIAPVTKRVQKRVIEMIVHGEDTEDIADYLHEEIQRFLDGDADLDEVGIPGGIGKRLESYETDTAQVRGAKYANLMLGTNFQRGSKPKRLYLEKVHPDFFRRMEDEEGFDPQRDPLYGEFKRDPDVICFEYADEVPDEFEVDWDKMLDKTLEGPIARIIEALGMSWEEVKSGQEQTGLGSFM